MVAIAPSDVEAVADLRHARVIAIDHFADLRVGALKDERSWIDLPIERIGAETDVDAHLHRFVVHAKYSCKAIAKRNHSTIKDAVGSWQMIATDDRICGKSPKYLGSVLGTIFPREIGQSRGADCERHG